MDSWKIARGRHRKLFRNPNVRERCASHIIDMGLSMLVSKSKNPVTKFTQFLKCLNGTPLVEINIKY